MSISCTQGNISEVLESIGRLFPKLRAFKASNLKAPDAEAGNEEDVQNVEGAKLQWEWHWSNCAHDTHRSSGKLIVDGKLKLSRRSKVVFAN